MKKVIIHIGLFKTGTTSLQRFLAVNSDRGCFRDCLYYPKAARIDSCGAHLNLAYEFCNSWKFDSSCGGLESIRAEISNLRCKSFVISAENLSSYSISNRDLPLHIVDCFKNIGCKVFLYAWVRPQWDYVDSYYCQGVKTGYICSDYSDYFNECLSDPMYDYEPVIDTWARLCDGVSIFPYGADTSVVRDFCDIQNLVLDSLFLSTEVRLNTRPGVLCIMILRALSAALLIDRTPIRERVKMCHHILHIVESMNLRDRPFSGLDAGRIALCYDRFVESNRRLSRKWGVGDEWYQIRAVDDNDAEYDRCYLEGWQWGEVQKGIIECCSNPLEVVASVESRLKETGLIR